MLFETVLCFRRDLLLEEIVKNPCKGKEFYMMANLNFFY